MFENFTGASIEAIAHAMEAAKLSGSQTVTNCHLLYGLARSHSRTSDFLESIDVNPSKIETLLGMMNTTAKGALDIKLGPHAHATIKAAEAIRCDMSLKKVYTGHVLLAVLDSSEGAILELLAGLEVETQKIRADIVALILSAAEVADAESQTEIVKTRDEQLAYLSQLARQNHNWKKELKLLMLATEISEEEVEKKMEETV
jgi:ATP-dependent Clp protease ATP-binding subunit ClpA